MLTTDQQAALKNLAQHPRWGEIMEMIEDGIPAEHVAQACVSDLGWTHPNTPTLADVETMLRVYQDMRAAVAAHRQATQQAQQASAATPPLAAQTHGAPPPSNMPALPDSDPLDVPTTPVDPLTQMEWLWNVHRGRLEREVRIEARLGKAFKDTHKEFLAGLRMLEAIASLRMDLGIENRQLGTVSVQTDQVVGLAVREQFGGASADLLSNPASRQRVLSVIGKIEGLIRRNVKSNDPIDITPRVGAGDNDGAAVPPSGKRRTGTHAPNGV